MMVVFYHCIGFYIGGWEFKSIYSPLWAYIGQWFNLIDIPAFVFVSGYLFKMLSDKNNYRGTNFVRKKCERLLLPYTFIGIALLTLWPDRYDIIMFFTGIAHLWFLLMLFVVCIVFYAFNNVLSKLYKEKSISLFITLCIVSFCISNIHLKLLDFFCIGRAIKFIPAFYLGYIVCQHNFLQYKKSVEHLIIITVLYSLFLYLKLLLINKNRGLMYYTVDIFMMFLAFGIIYLFYISLKKVDIKISPSIKSLDKCGLDIYIIHHIIIYDIFLRTNRGFALMQSHPYIAPVVLFVCVFMISWLISTIIGKASITITSWIK